MVDVAVLENTGATLAVASTDGQSLFDYDFLCYLPEDMRVEFQPIGAAVVPLVYLVDYVVAGLGQENGGSITLLGTVMVLEDDQLLMYRETSIKRLFDYQTAGDFLAQSINRELDVMTMIDQEARRDIDRSPKVPIGFDPFTITPGTVGQILAFDALGNLIPINQVAGVFKGLWSALVTYHLNDIVLYGGKQWRALGTSLNVAPVEGASWTLFLDGATILPGSITSLELGPLSVTEPKMANNAASSRTIPDDALLSRHYSDASILFAHLNPAVPATILRDHGVNPMDFGAVGDAAADDKAALDAAFVYAKSIKAPLFLPPGKQFRAHITVPWVWDLTANRFDGFKIKGSGELNSVIHLTTSLAANNTLWQIKADSDWYRLVFEDWRVQGPYDGTTLKLGRDDLTGPLNLFTARNWMSWNPLGGVTNSRALKINYMVNSHLDTCRANCYADGLGTNYGIALEMDFCAFNKFTNGSYGNASIGIKVSGALNSYANKFETSDIENVNWGVSHNSAASGNLIFDQCQFSLWTQYAIEAPASNGKAVACWDCNFSNAGFGPAAKVNPAHAGVVKFLDSWVVT